MRASKNVNNNTAVFIYDGKEILAETTSVGTKTNIFGNNMIATTGTDTLYYQYNNHGDVVGVLDESGTLKNEYDYDAFGNAITEKETVKNPYRYAGYYQDTESGLYYLRSRYYNPKTARFLTEDTASGKYTDPLSLNKYTYCHNQPVTGYDPDGHALHIVVGAVLGGVIGGVMGGISAAKNGGSVWRGALGGAVEGALVGGVGAATGGLGIGYAMAAGAAASAVGNVANQAISTGKVDKNQVFASAVAGAAGTAGAKIVGGALKAGSQAVSKAASHVLGKAGNQAAMKAGGSVLSKTIASSISGGITGAAAGASADLGMQATQIYLGVDDKDKIDFSQTAQSALLGGVIGAGVGAGSQTKFGQKVAESAKTGTKQLENKISNTKSAVKNGLSKLLGKNSGKTINPYNIRFSQSSVNGSAKIVESMRKNGWIGDPIDVVQMPDGELTTIDNTRVVAARRAGIDVKANIHVHDDLLPVEYIERFTTKKGVPVTWGDAINLRIGKQNAPFRNNNPYGSYEMDNIN